jgi:predicted glutamine amidotransferase
MCELLAMSARFPTTVHLSMTELARHGGDTGPHRDGWGDAFVLREPEAASERARRRARASCATAVFAHAHRRRNDAGEIRPPGLDLLCRHCAAADDGVALAGVSMPEAPQDIALVASVPLSAETWSPLPEGTLVVLREGRVVSTVSA